MQLVQVELAFWPLPASFLRISAFVPLKHSYEEKGHGPSGKRLSTNSVDTYPAPPPCANPLDHRSMSRSCSIALGCPNVGSPGLPIKETCSHSNTTKASVDILPASRGNRLLIGLKFEILTMAPLFCVRRVLEVLTILERSDFDWSNFNDFFT